MLPSPLLRGGALLGTLCMGVYLTMCLFNGLVEPYVCLKRDACCTCYVVHDTLGTKVVWKTIRVKWLLLERAPPAIHCFVQGRVGCFAHNTLGTGWGYLCIVSTKEGALHFNIRGLGMSFGGQSKVSGYCLLRQLVLQELL